MKLTEADIQVIVQRIREMELEAYKRDMFVDWEAMTFVETLPTQSIYKSRSDGDYLPEDAGN